MANARYSVSAPARAPKFCTPQAVDAPAILKNDQAAKGAAPESLDAFDSGLVAARTHTNAASPGLGDVLLDVNDRLNAVSLGLLALVRCAAKDQSEIANDLWWIGSKVLAELADTTAFVETARSALAREGVGA